MPSLFSARPGLRGRRHGQIAREGGAYRRAHPGYLVLHLQSLYAQIPALGKLLEYVGRGGYGIAAQKEGCPLFSEAMIRPQAVAVLPLMSV